ncbi:hypothetical protein A5730_20465 [Mycobacterium sp. ACS4054]|uniref:hypothetical protein n=1 Tax=Mycobacterium sp. ACS4054 TaxID=1834119 RepID=UPI0007FD039D|nr:hypothetical protein [Mycobacterium sp. ACS4054]OBF04186.1 hypothetical protein A5730_20465 [Mycobacterium sp. ACS4054]
MSLHPVGQLYEFTPEVQPTFSRRNPLVFVGALDEAEFIDMRLSPQRSRVGVLCAIQWCRDFAGSNVALVVLNGVGSVSWSNDDQWRQRPWHAQYGDWGPKRSAGAPFPAWSAGNDDSWAVDASSPPEPAGAAPGYLLQFGRLSVSGQAARIYIGHIEGLGEAPPDMGELSDAEIIAGFPQWSSVMEVREYYTYP